MVFERGFHRYVQYGNDDYFSINDNLNNNYIPQ